MYIKIANLPFTPCSKMKSNLPGTPAIVRQVDSLRSLPIISKFTLLGGFLDYNTMQEYELYIYTASKLKHRFSDGFLV